MVGYLDILRDWNFWGTFDKNLRARDYDIKLPLKSYALVLNGARRVGKSSIAMLLLKSFSPEEGLVINFEDPRLVLSKPGVVFDILDEFSNEFGAFPKVLLLDEVQELDGWERVVRTLLDKDRFNVIVTGSSSKLMSPELGTLLTGRHKDHLIFPLSFKEFLMWRGIGLNLYKDKELILRAFNDYLVWGGFPGLFSVDVVEKAELLRTYFDDVIFKDLIKRFDIKEVNKIHDLAALYLTNIASLQSFNKLRLSLEVSHDTVARFSKYFEIANLFFFLSKFSFSKKKELNSQKKVYVIDNGLFTASGFGFSQNKGKLFENLVFIELKRRGLKVFYWKNDYEVDFVIPDNKELIQVSAVNSFEELNPREVRALLRAKDELGFDNLLVLTAGYEDEREVTWFGKKGKIKFLPLWKWLLG